MRRGHGSTKVPNVKLRPPPPKEKAYKSAIQEHESMDVNDGPARPATLRDYSKNAKPFAHVILCSTGIRDKVTLFQHASELGAVCQHDLTSDITHLVATETGSAKYHCAVENGMAVMTPEWVEDAYQAWLQGDDVDFEESVRTHRLPFFSGLTICVTGSEIDGSRRQEIGRVIGSHGGIYSSSLTRQCTHLLVSAPSFEAASSTDKVRFAQRVNKDKKAQIHILWVEWLWDCITVLGRLSESKYQIELERPLPKLRPVTQQFTPIARTVSIGPSTQQTMQRAPPPPSTVDVSKDAPEPGMAPSMSQVQRNAQYSALWEQLRKSNLAGTARSNSQPAWQKNKSKMIIELPPLDDAADPQFSIEPAESPTTSAPAAEDSASVLSRLALAKSSSFHHASDKVRLKAAPFNQVPPRAEPSPAPPQRRKPIFAGMTFRLMGDANTAVLQGAIQSSGGMVLSHDDQIAEKCAVPQWHVVRLNTGSRYLAADRTTRLSYVTECWVEECLHEERVCDPDEHITFRPVTIATPLDQLTKMRLHISGLQDGNSLYTQRLARTLGAQVVPVFSKKSTTHLICPTPTGVKYEHALQWGIPTLQPEWLYEIAHTGIVPQASRFNVSRSPPLAIVDVTNQVLPVSAPLPLAALPSPPHENVQTNGLASPQPLDASGSGTGLRLSSKSPDKSNRKSATPDALNHLAATLGDKRKPDPADMDGKFAPPKKRTRPVTRVKSGDLCGSSSSAKKSTFMPMFNETQTINSGEEAKMVTETSFDTSLGESMRISYEDPESRAAKRSLMKLIGEMPESVDGATALGGIDSPADPPRPRPPVRRAPRRS